MISKAKLATVARVDVVFIRKSTQGQDEDPQIANVQGMLARLKVHIPDEHWFVGTVSRRKLSSNADFNRLMGLVDAGRVGTVYIESQDRWGTKDRVELFKLLGTLREHETRLFDLKAGRDLTERDFATEMMAIIQSFKSEMELNDLAYRSLRTRVNNFKETGSWPNGPQPFGFGKATYAPDGTLLWEWHPATTRILGHTWRPGPNGKLQPSSALERIPRRPVRGCKTVLVPSKNREQIECVRLVFDLFVRVGLSRRQICARMNKDGRRFYGQLWSHSLVSQILVNPAYVGDLHFGKNHSGDLQTFDDAGAIVPVKHGRGQARSSAVLVKENTHKGLIDRKTWKLAQAKLAAGADRVTYTLNDAYYLKPIFVCGHCGRNMSGRTEKDPSTGKVRIVYFCSDYLLGRQRGSAGKCGAHRITHTDAERLLFDKLEAMGKQLEKLPAATTRSIDARLAGLHAADEDGDHQWGEEIEEGIKALLKYFRRTGMDWTVVKRLEGAAGTYYHGGFFGTKDMVRRLPMPYSEFKKAVKEAEAHDAEIANRQLVAMRTEHEKLTLAWALAETSDKQRLVMKKRTDELEAKIAATEPRIVPLRKRLKALRNQETDRWDERKRLVADWLKLDAMEKGEALRRIFDKVTLYWTAEFRPALANPTRPRKTDRPGRYRYTLDFSRIQYGFADPESGRGL